MCSCLYVCVCRILCPASSSAYVPVFVWLSFNDFMFVCLCVSVCACVRVEARACACMRMGVPLVVYLFVPVCCVCLCGAWRSCARTPAARRVVGVVGPARVRWWRVRTAAARGARHGHDDLTLTRRWVQNDEANPSMEAVVDQVIA